MNFKNVGMNDFIPSRTTHTHNVLVESKLLNNVRFRYIYVMFQCTFGLKSKPDGLTVNRKPSKFLNCRSMFRITSDGEEYVIKSFKMLHNHPCSCLSMVYNPWSRRLPPEDEENLKPVMLSSPSTDEVIESIKDRTGKQVTSADVKIKKAQLSIGFIGTKKDAFCLGGIRIW
ncbi:hypothetical protein Smp_167780 [Schistosoma mansoni]|uniref:FLYWCH-type domain-containing protein n=1 Tax=Schistosoma mansoni TaxID=6183 RepID=G4VRN7_SCHMA|nr:hypothetical protein Smp_167780 [Schistosoma mansoni]|eukprot:XP_018655312.1 hypothetical protein Smp_167780 [Schistosoma mansoni]